MGKIYIIYDTIAWACAYNTFEFALFAVVEFLQLESEAYSKRYPIKTSVGVMEDYDKKNAVDGVLVATLYGEIKIYIKEVHLFGLANV